ncbi:MAG: hypothetical protein SP4CHLAM5_07230 [Chlamydiia bacterium]|nr:hypothetical protein [Chlamydiia bacterium]MCH9618590.1 hypothetical protein [Chlamydiia bacterium]MCH9623871.1 hypothetical protein [Chlamydiia bacterium]
MKQIPALLFLFSSLLAKDLETVFTNIYKNKLFPRGYPETVSGKGSMIAYTTKVREALPTLIKEYDIKTILDLPSGDFNWMKEVNLTGISYHGGDIVKEIIDNNIAKYQTTNIDFSYMNAVSSKIDKYDLIICRDLLLHLSNANIHKVIDNIRQSGSKYALISTYSKIDKVTEIQDGHCRPVNLALPFYGTGEPLFYIDEEVEGRQLGFWLVEEL